MSGIWATLQDGSATLLDVCFINVVIPLVSRLHEIVMLLLVLTSSRKPFRCLQSRPMLPLFVGPDGEFVAIWILEVEASSARKGEEWIDYLGASKS